MKKGIIIPYTSYTTTLGAFGFGFSSNPVATDQGLNTYWENIAKPSGITEEDYSSRDSCLSVRVYLEDY